MPDDIDAETIDAPAKPEPHNIVNRRTHIRIAPIQIGLLGHTCVIVIFGGARIVLPPTAPEFGLPVVWRAAISAGQTPQIPVALGIVFGRTAFNEPRMLVRGMIGD